MLNDHSAHIVEIFSSLQGEGIQAGERMTFVRFQRCNLNCTYCDTPQGLCHQDICQVETASGAGTFREIANPVSATTLCEIVDGFADATLSVTGGEPLEQADFLAAWLPAQMRRRRILLETNGTHVEALGRVLPFVHTVSMDIKLPSSTGGAPCWETHEAFLKAILAANREVSVKLVVTGRTSDRDIQEAIGLLGRANRYVPVVIQPVSPTLTFHQTVEPERVRAIERLCHAYLPDVRVIPQMHKQWNIL